MIRSARATIRDVVAAAGVSLTTVSDALSGKGRLPDATRGKVLEAAQQLNYRPNAIARGLRGQTLGLIGISIVPAQSATLTSVGYWATIATHVSEALLSAGYAPILLPHNTVTLAKLPIPIDGAIMVDPLDDDEVLAFFRASKIETVTIGRDSHNPRDLWVDDDYERGIVELLERTVRPGEEIAVMTLGPRKSYVVDALSGARLWARRAGSTVNEHLCQTIDDAAIDAALQQARTADVMLAQNDRLAIRLLARLKAAGMRVPDDIRLLSATDAPELLRTEPPITGFQVHPERLGQLAVQALLGRLQGDAGPERQVLPVDIAIRASAPALE